VTSVVVVIPFYGFDRARRRNLRLVRALYCDALPDWSCTFPSGRSLAQARNTGAACAPRQVIVFNDADTLCPPEQIREAVRLAAEAPGRVAAFDIYQRLTRRATESLTSWRDAAEATVEAELFSPPSNGCMAISRASFEEVGGYDESFVGWGYEDCEFNHRCALLFGEPRRVPGEAYHLWHGERRPDDSPLSEPSSVVAANLARYQEKVVKC
jgi:hypothetical protein